MKSPFTITLLFMLFAINSGVCNAAQTYRRSLTYKATAGDDLASAATVAQRHLCNTLLREVGFYLQTEEQLARREGSIDNYSETTQAITAGMLQTVVLREEWTPPTYFVEADITLDTAEVRRMLDSLINNRQMQQDLTAAHRRLAENEAEMERLKAALGQRTYDDSLAAEYRRMVGRMAADELFLMAYSAYVCGNYDEAVRLYRASTEREPNAVTYFNMGVAYVKKRDYAQAIAAYLKSAALNPADARVHYNLGYAYDDMQLYDEAISAYRDAVNIDAAYAAAYINMGICYSKLGNTTKRDECYRRAAALGNAQAKELLQLIDNQRVTSNKRNDDMRRMRQRMDAESNSLR